MTLQEAGDAVNVMPVRIQRRRTRGWRMPEGAVYVGRPTKWGNPYAVVQDGLGVHVIEQVDGGEAYLVEVESIQQGREIAIGEYSLHVGPMGSHELDMDEVRAELSGRDLVCWCPLDQPCHADVLLELANRERS